MMSGLCDIMVILRFVLSVITSRTWKHLLILYLVVFCCTHITYNENWPWQTYCSARKGKRNLPKWLGGNREQRILLWNLVEHFNETHVTGKLQNGKQNSCKILTEWRDEKYTDAIVIPPREVLFTDMWQTESRIKSIIHGKSEIHDRIPVLPKAMKSWQVLVLWHMESPMYRLPVPLSFYRGLFHLTATYLDHEQTDIHVPYGRVLPMTPSPGSDTHYQLDKSAILSQKPGLIAWISECNYEQERSDLYVKELKEHISVDVYGPCGISMDCDMVLSTKRYNCTDDLYKKYKFYLALESATCTQYVTDIMFDVLKNNVIPIALGGANFAHQLPPKSFINADDFDSPQHLARYLVRLDDNSDEYFSYFEWKKTHYVSTDTRIEGFSKLCDILHDESYLYKSRCFRPDDYWSADTQCTELKLTLFSRDLMVISLLSLVIFCLVKMTTNYTVMALFVTPCVIISPYASCLFRVSSRRVKFFLRYTLRDLFSRTVRRPRKHVRRRTYQQREFYWEDDDST